MKFSIGTAFVILVLAAIWVGSGMLGQSPANNTSSNAAPVQTTQQEKTIPEVRVTTLTAQSMEDTIDVTGQMRASQSVIIRSETEGIITELLIDRGDQVEKGQILAKLDIREREAKLEEARQLVNQRQIEYNAAKELNDKGFGSKLRLSEALAQLKLAKAQLKQANIEMDNIHIKAPFNGVINERYIELGDYLSRGNNLFHLVQLSPIKARGFISENQIQHVTTGDEVIITLFNKKQLKGVVTYIAAAADTDTRTFAFETQSDNDDHSIKDGLTAMIHIPIKEAQAYKISPSSLSLADDGTVGVKLVTEENTVSFAPVRLLKDSKDHIWISGLPSSIRLITVGHEFVVDGQQVTPVDENDIQDNSNQDNQIQDRGR